MIHIYNGTRQAQGIGYVKTQLRAILAAGANFTDTTFGTRVVVRVGPTTLTNATVSVDGQWGTQVE